MHVYNLKYKYKKAKDYVLNGVHFTLKTKKLNVIVGLNGAGKTTLFDCTFSVELIENYISLMNRQVVLILHQD
ncbi:AAA family ATPase [Fervidibacillus halotolerans]|uniref:AAA family ATPase n=1 Tax=Fervidibacillus halotolerans TaxID=2980027 RepID=A0A9E8M041_9BACI|nr:AAA family ATPase [Fervidibacillus halotolerans]WAA12925.1 AAA family ATPase [Fervidibacillus halotolerans]